MKNASGKGKERQATYDCCQSETTAINNVIVGLVAGKRDVRSREMREEKEE